MYTEEELRAKIRELELRLCKVVNDERRWSETDARLARHILDWMWDLGLCEKHD